MKQISVNNYDVFISYSAKNKEFAYQLATDLSQAGLRVWLDQWNIIPGTSFAEAIGQAVKESRFLLIVMSPDYFKSSWTRQEWQYALAEEIDIGGVRLIPILYQECEVPTVLRNKQWADFRDQNQYYIVLNRLVADLRSLASNATNSASPVETPRPGERIEELTLASVLELKNILKNAVEAFQDKPETVSSEIKKNEKLIVEEDICFIVMPFSIESLNIVYEDFVKPIMTERCMLRAERGDDVFGSNVVMDDITKSIKKARLVIADLTGKNANVFYEVGIAHALDKQVLLMTQSIDDVPFDLRHRRALVYEYSPRGCKKLEKDLFENIQKMLEY